MDFKESRPIYLQIADKICGEILTGKFAENERIPSVREGAAEKILQMRREMFMNEQLKDFFNEIDILKISINEIVELYNQRNKS